MNKSLRVLNLSKNLLTDRVCGELKNILDLCKINELYLHWNRIYAKGGIDIFEGLKSNSDLKVLDLSFNSLGKSMNRITCAPQIGEFLSKDNEMIHLDLSNNQFNKYDSLIISQGLVPNKTLYGFHYTGNYGYVDSRGFLIVKEIDN